MSAEHAVPVLRGAHRRVLDLARPCVMGILNVTPDSFSDGGSFLAPETAVQRGLQMVEEGASIIDIGGESTRPGADLVPLDVELARVLPVVEGLRRETDVFISVDTSKTGVVGPVCAAGADMINDVRALQAPGMLDAVLALNAATCVMHMQGDPATMQDNPRYTDLTSEVVAFLGARVAACEAAGMQRDRLCVDPGFGFGKTLAHNLTLMRGLSLLLQLELPILMGVSRKSMFARLFDRDDRQARVTGSLAAAFWAVQQGVGIIRAHDVRQTAQTLAFAHAMATNS